MCALQPTFLSCTWIVTLNISQNFSQFSVSVQNERFTTEEWKRVLTQLKLEFRTFQQDLHAHFRDKYPPSEALGSRPKIHVSGAFNGNFLEAINMALNCKSSNWNILSCLMICPCIQCIPFFGLQFIQDTMWIAILTAPANCHSFLAQGRAALWLNVNFRRWPNNVFLIWVSKSHEQIVQWYSKMSFIRHMQQSYHFKKYRWTPCRLLDTLWHYSGHDQRFILLVSILALVIHSIIFLCAV